MSQQGPIMIVSTAQRPSFASALDDAKIFPIIDTGWADASRAIEQLQPAAVLVAMSDAVKADVETLAKRIAARQPYLPLLAIDPGTRLPENAIPFSQASGNFDRLVARLRAALRIRSLHATVMRRLDDPAARKTLADIDPARDATVLLIGRGAAYPSLSVSLGERMGVVGARFRNLPVIVTLEGVTPAYDLPNLEVISGDPARIAANALPLIRQHAFEAHLSRTLRSIEAGGLLDPRTGLLTPAAFHRDLATAVYPTLSRGGGLSVARFAFDPNNVRAQLDGARILSRLMRQMDFGAVQEDGSVIVVFAETDLRTAHMIARRLSSVMRHTTHGKRDTRSEPVVTLATMLPSDSATSLLARLHDEARRVAS